VENPKLEDLTSDELLEVYHKISDEIDILKKYWTDLNRHQTKLLIRYYEITDESEQS
jgi:hypothetical protein